MSRPPVYLTLSQALSWMAFGQRMDRKSLNSELAGACFEVGQEKALQQLEAAVDALTTLGHSGQVEFQGWWTEPINPTAITDCAVIPAIKLADFRAFDITTDGLRRTRGILWFGPDISDGLRVAHEGYFSEVLVKATDLHKHVRKPLFQAPAPPRIIPGSLNKWFAALSPADKSLPDTALVRLAKDAFPDHSVPRREVEALRGKRLRGRPKKSP